MACKYATKLNWKECKLALDFSKKVPNFQLIRPLSIQQEVERFQAAGRNLKKEMGLGVYDFDDAREIDYTLDDPTRDPDYDLIDAATQHRDAVLALQAAKAAGTTAESVGNNVSVSEKDTENKVVDSAAGATESQPVTETAKRS